MSTSPVVEETNPPDKSVDMTDVVEEPEGPSLAELQAEIASLKRVNEDLKKTEQFWHEKYKSTGERREPEKVEKPTKTEPPQPKFDADAFIEAQTKGDEAGMQREIGKLGFLTKAELSEFMERIEQKIEAVGTESKLERMAAQRIAELTTKYPDLADPDTDLFKAASRIMEERVEADQDAPKSRDFVERCVKDARLEVLERQLAEGHTNKPEPPAGERERRISQQSGGVSRARVAKNAPQALTDSQRKIAANMGLTEEEYRKHQQAVFVER